MNSIQNPSWQAWVAMFGPGVIAYFASQGSALITHEKWLQKYPELAGILTTVITAVATFGLQFIRGGNYSIGWATLEALAYAVFAAVMHSQVWKDTPTEAKLLAFPRKLPKRGKLTSHYGGVPDDEATPAA